VRLLIIIQTSATDDKRVVADYRRSVVRLTRIRVEATRKRMNKCPREIFEVPSRCLSTPPMNTFKPSTSVPSHRVRAWFHSRGQDQNIDERRKEIICAEDEQRFMSFAHRVGLGFTKQDLEQPIGINDSQSKAPSSTRAGSMPPTVTSAIHASPSVQRLRTWYHMSHRHAFTVNGDINPPIELVEDRAFVGFALRLGLNIPDLEDMDLPIALDTIAERT
jgi:hypothetical protein